MYKSVKQILIFCIILFTFESCITVSYSFTGASIHPKDKTVSIKYFPNRALLVNPNLSQQFTEMMKDKFSSQTPLELVNKKGDLHFEGEITDYKTEPMSITQGQTAQTNRLTISIRVVYESLNNEKVNFDKVFTRYADYPSEKTLTEVEDGLVAEILEQITEDVFNASVVNW